MSGRLLAVVVCGAGPAAQVGRLIGQAQARGWEVQVIATPAGREFIDPGELEAMTGNPVRSSYRSPGQPRSRPADAVIVAPATYNTICKLAIGVSDTYALGVVAEAIGMGLPVVVLPFVNTALADRVPFRGAVASLRAEGVRVLLGPDGVQPHPPRTGDALLDQYPWHLTLDRVEARS